MPAFAPTFLNVSMIGFALFAAPYFHPPVLATARAVTVGGVLQLAYQLPHLKKIGMLVLPRINLKDAGAMRVVKQMGPAILGVSGKPDLPYHQYHLRFVSRVGIGVVDVLC